MGWRDALKPRKSSEALTGEEDISSITSDEPEPDWFRPADNGTYVGGSPDGQFRYLRFGINGKVYLADGASSAAAARPLLGPDNPDPTVGQYTAAGRFSMQKRFDRPIVCTVLALHDDGFTARVTCTNPGTNSSGEYRYQLETDPE